MINWNWDSIGCLCYDGYILVGYVYMNHLVEQDWTNRSVTKVSEIFICIFIYIVVIGN